MEIVQVVAINPYRKGNKGKVFSYRMDTYDKVIESAAVKKMIQQIRGELPIDGVECLAGKLSLPDDYRCG